MKRYIEALIVSVILLFLVGMVIALSVEGTRKQNKNRTETPLDPRNILNISVCEPSSYVVYESEEEIVKLTINTDACKELLYHFKWYNIKHIPDTIINNYTIVNNKIIIN